MTYRLAKKRTLEKAGFAYVAGWISKDRANEINEEIRAEKPKVAKALEREPGEGV